MIDVSKEVQIIFYADKKKWIGIAPFASFKGKTYPHDLMQKVVGYLQQQHSVFLFGHGPKETDQINIWAKAYPHVVSQALELPFSDQLDLIANLDVMLCWAVSI